MKSISARQANQEFSKLLQRVEGGEEVLITRRGVPVAKLVPATTEAIDVEREAAWRELEELLTEGVPMGDLRWTRDEIYER